MVDIRKITYKLVAVLENGTQLDLSKAAEDIGWEEGKGELAARISFYCHNATYQGKRLSQIIKPGAQIVVLSDWGEGHQEVCRGAVTEWQPSRSADKDGFDVLAYDDLFCFERSQDNRYITAGTGTKAALSAMFSDWGIPIGEYKGPDIVHAKTLYKNQSLGNISADLLETARKQGGARCLIRSTKGKVSVLPFGSNETIYHFDEDTNLTIARDKISTAALVTRVKIVGKEDAEGRAAVEAIVDGKTEFGIRQKILNRQQDTSLATAKAEAQAIIDKEGNPEREIAIEAPDVPFIRKGDKIHVAAVHFSGYFFILSVRHNAADAAMTLEIEPVTDEEEKAEETGTQETEATTGEFERGDAVIVNGRLHANSYGGGPGKTLSGHRGSITIKVDTSRPTPYHIDALGWVSASSITKA